MQFRVLKIQMSSARKRAQDSYVFVCEWVGNVQRSIPGPGVP